jgi:NAD(P)H-quinone oxidoreductase subunit 2
MQSIQDYLGAISSLTPVICLSTAILFTALWNLFFPRLKEITPIAGIFALLFAGTALWQQFAVGSITLFGGLYTVDPLTVLFGVLACGVGAIVILMTMGCESELGRNAGEFYTLLLVAVLAVMVLAGTTDLILLFIALETLSISCVVLAGFSKQDRRSNEAALKYLISTAATTATLLYGLSFLYGLTGSTSYYEIHNKIATFAHAPSLVVIFTMVLLLSAVGFKLSAVPFHMWTPDVYEGAPTPVTAFLSIGSKAGGFVVAIRLLSVVFASSVSDWSFILGLLAIASMIGGNLIALAQTSFKRMLAYSSIAHVGYILIGLISNSLDGLSAVSFYLIVYGLMNLGAFTGAILFCNETGSDRIDDYAGLFKKRPWLATGLAICLINLAGLPLPPAGFFAKAFVFWSGIQASGANPLAWTLIIVALLTSVPAIYYYMRVAIKMIVKEPSDAVKKLEPERKRMVDPQICPDVALAACVAGIVIASVMVNPIMKLAKDSVTPVTSPAVGMLDQNLN